MKAKIGLILGIIGLLSLGNAGLVLSEEQAGDAMPMQVKSDADAQWIWGEVINADAQNKAVTIKYLDYETDQEKEAVIYADNSTTYENIKSFGEIGPKNTLSIDYAVVDGKNIAKNISLEKPEASASGVPAQPETTAAAESKPVAVQPTDTQVENKSAAGDTAPQPDTGNSEKTETVNQASQ